MVRAATGEREHRRRPLGAEGWAGVAMLVMTVGVASPVLLGLAPAEVPLPAWAAILVAMLAAVLGASLLDGRRRTVVYAAAVVLAWALVLTAPAMGFLLVVLVVTAALGAYAAPLWATILVVVANTAVVALVTLPGATDLVAAGIVIGFYLLIQAATLLHSLTLIREQGMRRELAVAHVALRAGTIERAAAARTAERLRIARELHDAMGHQLTVLTLQLETARHVDGAAARQHVERADRVARALLGEVREVVGTMRVEQHDLEPALRELTDDLPGLEVDVSVDPAVRLDDAGRAAMLRAAQEVVTNALRHAEATRLVLQVVADGDGAVLVGRDDGVGDPAPVLGNGLTGLRERIEGLGGEVALDGAGDGFAVTVRLP